MGESANGDVWRPGMIATGIGSLPGTDIKDALAMTFGELPDLPYLPELPGRGPGADMIGRGAGLMVDLPVELYAGRWRIASHGGADLRRAHDLLERDLDVLTELADGFTGTVKIQATGAWTLAANLELPLGGLVLKDHGAVGDLATSLAEGLRGHVDDVRRRVPKAHVVLQLDEPTLPAVISGRVRTESGLHTYRAVDAARARSVLRSMVDGVGVPVVVHCCAADPPVALMREAGAAGVAVDLTKVKNLDQIGEVVDGGTVLFAGVTSTSAAEIADRVGRLLRDLGFGPDRDVVLTPACGLAGHSPSAARAALKACREASDLVVKVLE
ncbi:methionine synthase [Allorhizocola rhizosphaerae]|uniref:methionine synthase n=1 Tax=Allorhizocola rhizosphaerae TaxID=1872709 RepID=UPI001FE46719|nr:methionine synthase [Allorhizocola rhizosphaerae]